MLAHQYLVCCNYVISATNMKSCHTGSLSSASWDDSEHRYGVHDYRFVLFLCVVRLKVDSDIHSEYQTHTSFVVPASEARNSDFHLAVGRGYAQRRLWLDDAVDSDSEQELSRVFPGRVNRRFSSGQNITCMRTSGNMPTISSWNPSLCVPGSEFADRTMDRRRCGVGCSWQVSSIQAHDLSKVRG